MRVTGGNFFSVAKDLEPITLKKKLQFYGLIYEVIFIIRSCWLSCMAKLINATQEEAIKLWPGMATSFGRGH